jgi:hypothetical protein
MLRELLDIVDDIYRWVHNSEPIGTIFFIKLKTYRGDILTLSDGTVVKHGNKICTLHFNNERIALIHRESEGSAGFSFARHLDLSLSALAKKLHNDKGYEEVVALSGITWMPRSGAKKIGFDSYPVCGTYRLFWLKLKFSLYLSSVGKKKAASKIRPHAFWMSKKRLLVQHLLD